MRPVESAEEVEAEGSLPEWFRQVVEVAMRIGMRRGELLNLRWSDVDLETASVRTHRDKAREGRWTVLSPETLNIVLASSDGG